MALCTSLIGWGGRPLSWKSSTIGEIVIVAPVFLSRWYWSVPCEDNLCTEEVPVCWSLTMGVPPGGRSWTWWVKRDLRSENARSLDLADIDDPRGGTIEGAAPGDSGEVKRIDLEGLPALALGPPIVTLVSIDKVGVIEACSPTPTFARRREVSSELVCSVPPSIPLAMPKLFPVVGSSPAGTRLEAAVVSTTSLLSRKYCTPWLREPSSNTAWSSLRCAGRLRGGSPML